MPEPTSSTRGQALGIQPATGRDPDVARLFDLITEGVQGSVLLTGQTSFRGQRSGRYTPASTAHPAKMLPAIPRYLIATYTNQDDLVADPMAGIGTTIVEAMHLGRHGVGVEYEHRWAHHAANNIRLATSQGATGTGEIYTGDARRLPALLPTEMHGRITLVVTSPPYGDSTHGRAITPGPGRGKVRKINNRYGADAGNLAYAGHDELIDGFIQILTGCAALLRPGGHVAVTARPYRQRGELIDIPGMVAAAGLAAGLTLVEELVALIAGVRDGVIVPRASFFQRKNVTEAVAAGDPQWLIQHEDLLVFRLKSGGRYSASSGSALGGRLLMLLPCHAWIDVHRRPPPTRAVAPPHPRPTRAGTPKGHPIRARPTHTPPRGPHRQTRPTTSHPPATTRRPRSPIRPIRQAGDDHADHRRRMAARPSPDHR